MPETEAVGGVRLSPAGRLAWAVRLPPMIAAQIAFPYRSRAAIERAQRRRIGATIAHAREHVPYYRETMGRLGLAAGDVAEAADLSKLPVIEREQVQRDPEYFVSQARPLSDYISARTGGSTGEPLVIYHDLETMLAAAAYRQRSFLMYARLTRALRPRRAEIASPLSTSAPAERAFRRSSFLKPGLRGALLSLSLLEEPADALAQMREFGPDIISTYGSYVEALLGTAIESEDGLCGARVVIAHSDGISDTAIALVRERFGATLISAYGANEAFHIGTSCEHALGFHQNIDLVAIRIVDAEDRDLPDGEQGSVLTSNLFSRGTMLINYRVGDEARKIPEPCRCRRTLPLLSFVAGRSDDWLRSAGGEPIHAQAVRSVMSSETGVLRYQANQNEPGDLHLLVVALPDCDREATAERVRNACEERLGAGSSVRIEWVKELPRTAAGKVRQAVVMRREP